MRSSCGRWGSDARLPALLFAGIAHQVWSGTTRHRRSPVSRRAHKIIGYAVLVVALVHLPFGVLDIIETFVVQIGETRWGIPPLS